MAHKDSHRKPRLLLVPSTVAIEAKTEAPSAPGVAASATVNKAMHTVREAAFLLQLPEMKVRRLVESSKLERVSPGVSIDAASVRRLFPDDGTFELRRLAQNHILSGRFHVPAPERRWGPPASLEVFVEATKAIA